MLKYKIRKKMKEKEKKKPTPMCLGHLLFIFSFFKFNTYIKLKDLIKCKYIIRLLISQIIFIRDLIG